MKTNERVVEVLNGWALLVVEVLAGLLLSAVFLYLVEQAPPGSEFIGILLILAAMTWVVTLRGFYTLQPNEAAVLILFGKYIGTDKTSGFRWGNPLYVRRKVSLRARNLNGETIKVNDSRGNPIEIATVVVWRVRDTAAAVFDVDDFNHFVTVQSESALRHLTMAYPYDDFEGETMSLRGSTDEISEALQKEVQDRVAQAGVYIEEARLSHLAYAQEIASAMLQRQQAEAIVAARSRIVEGAVGMVEDALAKLKEHETITLDEERQAAMVSNLLVVLCAHESPTPVVNAGTLYTG